MTEIFISPGLRTPFAKAGGAFAHHDMMDLSVAVARAMYATASPDLVVWGHVIPSATISNIARELVFEAGLNPAIPAFSTVLACSTSFMGAIEAAGMIGQSDLNLALVGGVETMSHVSLGLKMEIADRVMAAFGHDPAAASAMLGGLATSDFDLPRGAWANRQSGRSQGQHTEDTARHFGITRAAQDRLALLSHQGAVAGQDDGFFDDLIIPFAGLSGDALPRRDTSLEKLARLPAVFEADGTLTAGNSSPVTDGAASVWIADRSGMARLGRPPCVRLIAWQISAMDYLGSEEGILMAPARAIPRLLARQGLRFEDVASWNIHEAFAAQVLANVSAALDPAYRRAKAEVDFDMGPFPWPRLNPHGGSLAIGHPFAATGARILSQAAKELETLPPGAFGVVSLCADGGQGTVALLQRVRPSEASA